MAFKLRLPAFIVALALPMTACSSQSCLDKYYTWDYGRMPLDQAVQKVSERSNCPIQIDPSLTQDKTSHGIHLNRQPYQAMRHMLWGTGLKVSRTDTGLKIVARHPGEATAAQPDAVNPVNPVN